VTVIEIKGGQVRIGIDAPREIDVYREEIYEQVRQENLNAVANADKIRDAVQDQPRRDPDA
jgi:carbon storage regulator